MYWRTQCDLCFKYEYIGVHISKNILLNETLHSKIELKVKYWQMGIRLRHFFETKKQHSSPISVPGKGRCSEV